ncbi:hypothetical protein LZ554_007790 [Drepanopeziza brunnea f. sp. 'monogermtubi']|nr:hypothetical protein LZ554_007790 [Drepanopeziza brunnea f. sp. 'monogermtubi']
MFLPMAREASALSALEPTSPSFQPAYHLATFLPIGQTEAESQQDLQNSTVLTTAPEEDHLVVSVTPSAQVMPTSSAQPDRPQFTSMSEFAGEYPSLRRPISPPQDPFNISFFDPTDEGIAFIDLIMSHPVPDLTADETDLLREACALFTWDAFLAPNAINLSPAPLTITIRPFEQLLTQHLAQTQQRLASTQPRSVQLLSALARQRHTLGIRVAQQLIGSLTARNLEEGQVQGLVSFYYGALKRRWDELVLLADGVTKERARGFRQGGWIGGLE